MTDESKEIDEILNDLQTDTASGEMKSTPQALRNKRNRRIGKIGMIVLPLLILVAAGIFLAVNTSAPKSYYTIDINPSICINTDKNDIVTSIDCLNEDAKTLLQDKDLVGLPVADAIEQIIAAAAQAGYITEGKYVLIGRFSDEDTAVLNDLQSQLEADFGDMITLLVVSGTLEDKKKADDLNVSAGLLMLSQMADGVQLTSGDKIEDILAKVNQINNPAPATQAGGETSALTVSGSVSGDAVKLSWTQAAGTGFSGYKIVASKTNSAPKYPDDGYIKFITDISTTNVSLYAGYGGLEANESYYFSVTYLYSDGSTVAGNAVKLKVPVKSEGSSGGAYTTTNISGSISGNTVSLNWDKITNDSLDGYKVMYSFTDSSPVYGESGCNYARWITDESTTSCTINVTELSGYSAGATCYFSITALYDSHNVKKAGNAISLTMPAAVIAPYESSSISGSITDASVSLNWTKITHAQFSGYKVVYSFTDTTPVYGESGCYYYDYITDPNTTSAAFYANASTLTGYSDNVPCYFSITVLYSDGTKKAGNVITLTMPSTK